jgi:hypothetical protein
VIRNIQRPGVRLEEFNSGTEAEVGGAALSIPSGGLVPMAPVNPIPVPAPAPAVPQPAIPSTMGSPAPAAGPQPVR